MYEIHMMVHDCDNGVVILFAGPGLLVLLQSFDESNCLQDVDNVVNTPSLHLEGGSSIIQGDDTAFGSRELLQKLFTQQAKRFLLAAVT